MRPHFSEVTDAGGRDTGLCPVRVVSLWEWAELCVPHMVTGADGHSTQSSTTKRASHTREQTAKQTNSLQSLYFCFFLNCLWIPSCCLEMHHVRSRPTYKNSLCSAEVEPGKGLLQRNNAPLPPLTANGKYKWSLRNIISSL